MIRLEDYNYNLPEKLIAKKPASPRDSAKLFVYDTKTDAIKIDKFKNIDKYLPKPSLLVLNQTKVLPARVTLYKQTGGKVEVLFLVNELKKTDKLIKVITDRQIRVGQSLYLKNKPLFVIKKQQDRYFFLEPLFKEEHLFKFLEQHGTMPIPKYIKGSTLTEKQLRDRYQTVFSKQVGSVAAPTASLHFTNSLLKRLLKQKVDQKYLILHVGFGTFAPINQEQIKSKKLFVEYTNLSSMTAAAIKKAKLNKIPIFAVGTTTTRTLESRAKQNKNKFDLITKEGSTDMFIMPGYKFKVLDGLITNFHIPKSSLMLLVDAFLKHKKAKRNILDLYKIAIKKGFRFYSFGDSMLIKTSPPTPLPKRGEPAKKLK